MRLSRPVRLLLGYVAATALVVPALVAPGLLGAPPAAAADGPRITSPEPGRALDGLVDLEVEAPAGTTAVRWMLDGTRLAELTDLYAQQVGVDPSWDTATDASWWTPGRHTLTVEADTASGTTATSVQIDTRRAPAGPGTVPLTGSWSFARAADLPDGALEGDTPPAVSGDTSGWADVAVPSSIGALDKDWNSQDGLLGVYRRSVDLAAATPGERSALVFESCYFACRVFLNGTQVGASEGGYTPHRFDVTDAVREGSNELAVIVDNRLSTMRPLDRSHNFYWNWGGLLQEVRFERTPATALVELTAEGTAAGQLTLRPQGVNGTGTGQRVTAKLSVDGPDGRTVVKNTTVTTTVPAGGGEASPIVLDVPGAQVWDLENPRLYTVHLKATGPAAWQRLSERTGFRDVAVDGPDLTLNGEVVQDLQGFNRHADYPGLGRTQPGGLAQRELEKLHDKGFRLFRPAHYPTTPDELDAADELGLLVLEEVNVTGLTGAELASQEVRDFGAGQLTRMIQRDRSHPSLFGWSVGNENLTEQDGAATYVGETIELGRQLDPTRLFTQVTHRGTNDTTLAPQDFVAQNYYAGWYTSSTGDVTGYLDRLQEFSGGKPLMLSEYGAEGVRGRAGFDKGSEWFQGQNVDEHNRLLDGRPGFIGKMYWTSTEFWCRPDWSGGNPDPVPPFHTKGLLGYDRVEKLAWRVMFSPVRIEEPAPLDAPPGEQITVTSLVRVSDARHAGARGTVQVEPPPGFTATPASVPFTVSPDGSTDVRVTLTGTLDPSRTEVAGLVRAVIDEETEAQPRQLVVRRADTAPSPASDSFDSPTLDANWSIVRPDASGWSLTDRPGSLRLSTLPGGVTQSSNDGPNLFVRENSPVGDFTAVASVDVPTADTDYQQVGLFAYAGDDDYVRLSLGHIDGRRAVEVFGESRGRVTLRASVPVDETSVQLRMVRRASAVAAEFSTDGGQTWQQVGEGTVSQRVKVALQAVGGRSAPPVVDTFVNDLKVLVSGSVAVSPAPSDGLLLGGERGEVPVTVDNQSDTAATAQVSFAVPEGWEAETVPVTLPPFSAEVVQVPVTPPVAPAQATLEAEVTSGDRLVVGRAAPDVITTPAPDQAALALDGGSPTSPVLDGYQRLSPADTYDAAKGFGWVGATPDFRDRGRGDALRRDFTLSRSAKTLRVHVPPGQHDVYLLRGDTDFSSGATSVSEGSTVLVPEGGSLSTNEFEWMHFSLDGGADGRDADLVISGTGSNYWRMNALVLLP